MEKAIFFFLPYPPIPIERGRALKMMGESPEHGGRVNIGSLTTLLFLMVKFSELTLKKESPPPPFQDDPEGLGLWALVWLYNNDDTMLMTRMTLPFIFTPVLIKHKLQLGIKPLKIWCVRKEYCCSRSCVLSIFIKTCFLKLKSDKMKPEPQSPLDYIQCSENGN